MAGKDGEEKIILYPERINCEKVVFL